MKVGAPAPRRLRDNGLVSTDEKASGCIQMGTRVRLAALGVSHSPLECVQSALAEQVPRGFHHL